MKKTPCLIFDLDGTIANQTHRLHLVKSHPRRWQEFFDLCGRDTPYKHIRLIMRALWNVSRGFDAIPKLKLFIVSGRPDSHREVTEAWLWKYGIPYHEMYMRVAGDTRPDTVIKAEILDQLVAEHEVLCAFDDRPSVIKLWKSRGIPVLEIESQDWSDDEGEEECYGP
jgi:hypothetical protein